MNPLIHSDEEGMRAALAQSARGRGWASPRPSVGCVLVKNGEIIGAGYTQPGNGNPHAEVMALRDAAARTLSTQGATAYVTLEPCSHFGTTPPCANALIEAGVARAVCGVRDPNPAVDGRGYDQLRAAGMEVLEGVLREECVRAQDDFLFSIIHKKPLVTLKFAASLDGKIALQSGESQWISGEESRHHAHRLRHQHDAILVGIETVLADDPQLSARPLEKCKQPLRIVLDSRGRIPLDARVLRDGRVLIATTRAMPNEKRAALENIGAQVLLCENAGDGENARVDITQLWPQLYAMGVCSVLVEGGARIAGAMLSTQAVHKIVAFIAPKLLGENARGAVAAFDVERLVDAPSLQMVKIEALGNDAMISGYTRASGFGDEV